MTSTRFLAFALALLAAAASAAPAHATTVLAKDFAALCAEADLVFVGTVETVRPRWRDRTRQAIETVVTFAALTWLRGAPRATIELTFGGGEMDGLREEIAGVPRFLPGERRVLFARAGDFVSPLVGFSQGYFRVVDGPEGPSVLDADGRAVTGLAGAARRRGAANDAAAAVPLATFLDRVRAQLATDGEAP